MRGLGFMALVAGLMVSASAQRVIISEAMVNPPGSPDAGREFVEIQSCRPSQSLQGVWLIGIDGEFIFNPGNIHWAIDLSSYSTGSNGLLLVRDSSLVLLDAPAPETTVVVIPDAFTPASMGNDSYTVALVRGFTGQPGDDIDTNDDGVVDNPLWTEVLDAFAWLDGDDAPGARDQIYTFGVGTEVTTASRTESNGNVWEPDAIIFFSFDQANWIAADVGRVVAGQDQGPFQTSTSRLVVNGSLPSGYNRLVTPGNLNQGMRAPQAGDVNCDGCVDDADLLQVLFAFGGSDADSDVNSDGIVDDADLLIVLFNFGSGC
ncbi:MAG: hypothetical protein SNJ72_01720 [Fimbriimonadales bacterium]